MTMEPGAPVPVVTPGRASERSCNAGFSIMQYISGSAVLTAIVLLYLKAFDFVVAQLRNFCIYRV